MKKIIFVILFLFIYCAGYAEQSFVVKHIEINGLQRVTRATTLNYLPVKIGEYLSEKDTPAIIAALHKAAFFEDIKLSRSGYTLIIDVVERPTIGMIKVLGNKDISSDQLNKVLKENGLADGKIYNNAVLEKIQIALKTQYHSRGKYNATVSTTVKKLPRNRVAVTIDISEGYVAKIRQIKIIGNKAFSEKQLLSQFLLSTPSLWTLFSSADKYSQDKMDASLEALRSYYLDRGFLKFTVNSTQVSLTPDRKSVYIDVHVTEGLQYTLGGYEIVGDLKGYRKQLTELVALKVGTVFSRKAVINTGKDLSDFFADKGYLHANIDTVPEVDDKKQTAKVIYRIQPHHLVYVNRISFTGNLKTADYVLRREMRLMEAGLVSSKEIKSSERRLRLLGYLKDVNVKVKPVPAMPDKVDLVYSVKESGSAELAASLGYSTGDGILYTFGFSQPNFLGSGNALAFKFQNTSSERDYQFSYTNPYYTHTGISRGFELHASTRDPGRIGLASYSTNNYGASIRYGIPIAEYDRLSVGLAYEYLSLTLPGLQSTELSTFLRQHGTRFDQLILNTAWVHTGYDRAVFPTKGFNQSFAFELSMPAGGRSLRYYKVNYAAHWYKPLISDFILGVRANAGFGDGYSYDTRLPFFKNYFAGGIDTIRGYEANSLGPKDSLGNPNGANLLILGGLDLVLPEPISTENLRTSLFLDAGNVFSTYGGGIDLSQLRYSTGVAVEWQSPFGILRFSLARTLFARRADKERIFEFSLGRSF